MPLSMGNPWRRVERGEDAQEARDHLRAHFLDQAHLGREVLFTQLPDDLVKGNVREAR